MTNRELRRQINRLAWPVVASMVLIRGVGIIDMIILGRTGVNPFAAIGLGQQITFLGMALVFALSVGVNVMVAYCTGAQEIDKRTRIANSSIYLSVMVGLILILLGTQFSRSVAYLMGARDEVLELCWKYLKITWLFYTFRIFVHNLTSIFQGAGDTRTPMFVVSLTNLIHIALAYVMVYGKAGFQPMGIEGAAWATVISDFIGALLLFMIAQRRGLIRFLAGYADRADLKKLWALAYPVVGERLLFSTATLVYNSVVLHYSVAAYAATQIVANIEAFSFMPGMAYMQVAQVLVGQNLGAKNPERAIKSGYQSCWIAFTFMSLVGLTFLIFPAFWVSIFTNDPEVGSLGIVVCQVAAFLQGPMGMTMVFAGALRGGGETRYVMYVTFVGAWLVRVVLSTLFAYVFHLGIVAVWWVMACDWVTRSVLLFLRYRRGEWRLAETAMVSAAK